MPRIKKKILINLMVLLVTVVLLLLILEVGLALFFPQKAKIDIIAQGEESNFNEVYGWTDHKNKIYSIETIEYENVVSVNSEGFNDEEWTLFKEDNEVRYVALGDSFTQAVQVPNEMRYTEKLGSLLSLSNPGLKYNVLNYAAGGYSTCNEYFVLFDNAINYEPNVVFLFVYTGNDFTENVDDAPRRPVCFFNESGVMEGFDPPEDVKREDKSFSEKLILKTHTGALFMNFFRFSPISFKVASLFGSEPHYNAADLFDVRLKGENEELIKNTGYIIKGIDRQLYSEGIPLVVVIIPHRAQIQDDIWEGVVEKYGYESELYDLRFPNNYLANYLFDEEILYIDLYEAFRDDYMENGKDLYFKHDGHLSERGHELLALTVFEVIHRPERDDPNLIKEFKFPKA